MSAPRKAGKGAAPPSPRVQRKRPTLYEIAQLLHDVASAMTTVDRPHANTRALWIAKVDQASADLFDILGVI